MGFSWVFTVQFQGSKIGDCSNLGRLDKLSGQCIYGTAQAEKTDWASGSPAVVALANRPESCVMFLDYTATKSFVLWLTESSLSWGGGG